ncbi:MAG TPA: Gfo/Idh/MocA family oxidoreductase [Anaerolineae bacterium]
MAGEKARVAVIGTGWWSTYAHIPGLQANPAAALVAIADRSPVALDKAVAAYGPLKSYTDYRQMLAEERLDGVVVAVNHNAHYQVARDCLEAGLHVMLEKPMTLKAGEAHALLDLARARSRELIIGYPWHYTEATRRARQVVQSGQLGRIQYVSCDFAGPTIEFYRNNDEAYRPLFHYPVTGPGKAYADPVLAGGGQGHLQVTHSAASVFFITGLAPERVSCFMENWDVPVDLVDAITVRFRAVDGGRAVGVLGSTGNMCAPCGTHFDVRVYCEEGHIMLDQATGTLFVRRHDNSEETFGPLDPDDTYPRFATSANLVDVILGRGENRSPAEVGVKVVELLEAAYRSAADDGRVVSIDEVLQAA